MMNGNFYIVDNHLVEQPGVDYGQSCPTVVAINILRKTIAVHQKGCSSWSGRGTSSYYPSSVTFGTFKEIGRKGNKIRVFQFVRLLDMESTRINSIEVVKKTLSTFMGGSE